MAHQRLWECEAKLRRARDDLNQLELAIKVFRKEAVYRLSGYFNPPESNDLYGRLDEKVAPAKAVEWSIEIGCIAHNFRSALDYLVGILSEIDQQRPLTQDEVDLTEFPIFTDPAKWIGYKRKNRKGVETHGIALLSTEHRKAIDELQPCDPAHGAVRNAPLGWLQAMNNIDKHRALLVVATRMHAMRANIVDERGGIETFFTAASTDFGPDIRMGSLTPAAPLRKEQVELQAEFNVVFGEGSGPLERLGVVVALRGIEDVIHKHVFPAFQNDVGALSL